MARFEDARKQQDGTFYSDGVAPFFEPIVWDGATKKPTPGQDPQQGATHQPIKLIENPPGSGNYEWKDMAPGYVPAGMPGAGYDPSAAASTASGDTIASTYAALKAAVKALGVEIGQEQG